MKHGIVDKYVAWDDITNYLSESLSKYGLQTKIIQDRPPNITMRKESEFDPNDEIDPDYIESMEVHDEILNTFGKRSRQVSLEKAEGRKYYQRTSQRKKNTGSLMQRIREEERVKEDDSRVSQYKGMEFRYTERQMPEKYKDEIPEYILYDEGEKINEVAQDMDARITMPNEMGIFGAGFHVSKNKRQIGTFNGIANTFPQ